VHRPSLSLSFSHISGDSHGDETTNANEVGRFYYAGGRGWAAVVGRAVVDLGGKAGTCLLAMQIALTVLLLGGCRGDAEVARSDGVVYVSCVALTVSRLKLDSCQNSCSRRRRRRCRCCRRRAVSRGIARPTCAIFAFI